MNEYPIFFQIKYDDDLRASFWETPHGSYAYLLTIRKWKDKKRPDTYVVQAGLEKSPWWAYYRAYHAVRELSMGDFSLPSLGV